ncbi:hypothetical protein [Ruegeria arenilitoris]|uniref:hypothetical protein n=1 Tax=Ruegeria arenilitoris TaxID=1173585 RepID=UPI00147E3CCA|nr:hypothetical protein [Ruegeria arenilitoris]
MDVDESRLARSEKGKSVVVDGYRFEIKIYRPENQNPWTLEIVDFRDASYVWDDKFSSDQEAFDVAVEVLYHEGAVGFMAMSQKP